MMFSEQCHRPVIEISFCTTCFNRLHQLRETFAANAAMIEKASLCEWVILDYGSEDGLAPFLESKLIMATRRIRIVRELSGRAWHLSVAKNMAHRMAQGNILFNLDCDNFIADAALVISRYFRNGCQALHLWTGIHRDGTSGRIALTRKLFYRLGGYNEAFLPMGFQDLDLLARISALNLPVLSHPCLAGAAIRNTKSEGMRYCSQPGLAWEECDRLNRQQSAADIAAGRLVANAESGWADMNIVESSGLRP